MDYARLNTDLKDLQRRNRALGLVLSGLVIALLVALGTILKIAGTERTVIVPPAIDRTFWVTRERASPAYLEQMASYVAYLVLDVDPETIDWKRSALLDWVAPDQHAAMKTRQDLEADRLKRINGATYFRPQQLVASEERQSVVLRGRLRTQVNGHETSNDTKAYVAEFDFAGGRAQLKTFKDVTHEDSRLLSSTAAPAGTR